MTTSETLNNAATTNEAGTQQQGTDANAQADANAQTQTQTDGTQNPNDTQVNEGEGDQAKVNDDANKDAKDKPLAPEKYGDFEMPEGVEIDPELMGEYQAIAKELNLTQEQAQKLASLGGKLSLKSSTNLEAVVEQTKAEWATQSKADTEFGGVKLTENLATAKKTLDTFGTPGLRDLLNQSGLGNHPEVIRTFYRIGKQISEDNVLVSGNRTPGPANHADKLYGNTSNKT